MNQSYSPRFNAPIWLTTQLAIGIVAGCLGIIVRETTVPLSFLLVNMAIAFALTLLVATFIDRFRLQVGFSVMAGVPLLVLLALYFMTEPTWYHRMVLPPALFLFALVALSHISGLAEETRTQRALLASAGTALSIAALIFVLIAGIAPVFALREFPPFFAVMFALVLIAISLQALFAPIKRAKDMRNLQRSFMKDSLFDLLRFSATRKDLIHFAISTLFISVALATLAMSSYRIASGHFGSAAWDTWTWLFMFAAPLGAGMSLIPLRQLGAKRSMVLVVLIWIGLVVSGWFSHRAWEVALLHVALTAVLGMLIAVGAAFQAAITPKEKPAQMASVFALFAAFGIAIARVMMDAVPPSALVALSLACMFVGLYLLQMARFSRAAQSYGERVTTLRLDDVDADDWEDHDNLAQHHWFSRFSQIVARICLELFFGRIHIRGMRHLSGHSGAILVANHPNTFLDPLLITAICPSRLHYLAKSTLWRVPMLGSVLERFGAIPVQRRQDHPEMRTQANDAMFDAAREKLLRGAQLLVFPEGVSAPGLSLKPLKTGAVRLALHTLADSRCADSVAVIPIGIDYEEPTIFRSGVTLRIGEPLEIADTHGPADVRVLTQSIADRLRDLIPHLETRDLEDLVLQIQNLYGSHVERILETDDPSEARLRIAEAVNHYHRVDPDTVNLFKQRLDAYFHQAENLATPANHPPIPIRALFKAALTLLSPTTIGLILNWLPYRITGGIVERMEPSTVWRATTKLAVGTLVYALYYVGIACSFGFTVGWLSAYLVTLFLLGTALMALGAVDRFAFRMQQLTTIWRAFWTQDTDDELAEMRVQLIQDLERFREGYAFYNEGLASP